MKKTVVIGASDNPERYSYRAVMDLLRHGHPVVAVGQREGEVGGLKILTGQPKIESVDTVTLYVGAKHQPPLYEYILSLKPERIIFNPGTENRELEDLARSKGIEILEACTLTMLAVGNY